jgi:CHAT domain-containing protein
MDTFVSSYTPTLKALLKPALGTDLNGRDPKMLVVSRPDTSVQNQIQSTEEQAALVQSQFPESTNVLSQTQSTVAAVLEGMKTHSWVHLACHGFQSDTDPMKSGFSLYDGKLTLLELISQALPHAELAFLSACETASEDPELPDEIVQLAAGMLSAGYKSVIGRVWSAVGADAYTSVVAGKFYEIMKEQLETGGELRPAYALHEATRHLRKTIGVNDFLQWIPFVHFGI